MEQHPSIFLMGPTASGKSALALRLAELFPVEIVSVDSALVYRGMDIGTAKPDKSVLARTPHHLIDILDPTESYSAAQFRSDALRLVADITGRGKLPLLVGGTMLYFKALREGLSPLPKANATLRAALDERARRQGWPALHEELRVLDPPTAARFAQNDAQRIQRALEVCYQSGEPMSRLIATSEREAFPSRLLAIALVPSDRAVLHQRTAARLDAMLANGLIDEVIALRARYRLHVRLPSMRCVGYRQVWEALEGRYDRHTLRERAIAATRQLAKRQLTWLRAMPEAAVFDCLRTDLLDSVSEYLKRELSAGGTEARHQSILA